MSESPEIQQISLESFKEGIRFLAEKYHEAEVMPEQQDILAHNIFDLIAVTYASNKDNWQPFAQYMDEVLPGWEKPGTPESPYIGEIKTDKNAFDTHQKVTSIIYQARKDELRPIIKEVMDKYAATGYKKDGEVNRWKMYEGIPLKEGQIIVWGITEIIRENIINPRYPIKKLADNLYFLVQYGWGDNTEDINPFSSIKGLGTEHPVARWIRKALAEKCIAVKPDEADAQSYSDIVGYTEIQSEDKMMLDKVGNNKAIAASAIIYLNGAEEYQKEATEWNENQQKNIDRACLLIAEAIGAHPRLVRIRDVFKKIRTIGTAASNPFYENHSLAIVPGETAGVLRRNMLRRLSKVNDLTVDDKGSYEELTKLFLSTAEEGEFNEQKTPQKKVAFGSTILKLKRASDIVQHPDAYQDMTDEKKVPYITTELSETIGSIPECSLNEWYITLDKTAQMGFPPLKSLGDLKESSVPPIPKLRKDLAARMYGRKIANLEAFDGFFINIFGNEEEKTTYSKAMSRHQREKLAMEIAKRLLQS